MRTFSSRLRRNIDRVLFAALAISLLISALYAQQPSATSQQSAEDRVALYQALLDLTNPWTVMCIAAHPDDEDGSSLIVMRRKYGAHTVTVFSTFGEGGQNAIGPELYEELGAIRARETMAAAEIQGSEPYFLGLKDFGYSKSADEAFRVWGHNEALRRMVLQIRKLRPDVIITNHSVTNNDHGHHQATARLVLEAFDAAADSKRFPDQLKDGVATWQVQRLFVRVGRSNQAQAETSPVVTIDPNERDSIRGTVYAEEALRALQKHATQGPWPKTFAEFAARFRSFSGQSAAPGQLPLIRYVLVREAKDVVALPKESHYFLEGLRLPEEIAKQLAPPTIDGKPLTDYIDHRDRILDALVIAAKNKRFNTPIDESSEARRGAVLQRFQQSLALAGGLSANLVESDRVLIPGQQTSFDLVISNQGNTEARVGLVAFGAGGRDRHVSLFAHTVVNSTVAPGKTIRVPLTYSTPNDAHFTVPHAQHLYDETFMGKPIAASTFIDTAGASFPVFAYTVVDVVPPIEIVSISPSPLVVTSNTPTSSQSFSVTLTNHQRAAASGRLAMSTNLFPGARFENGPSFSLGANETKKIDLPLGSLLGLQRNGQQTKPSTSGTIPMSVLVFKDRSQSSSNARSVQAVIADAQVQPNIRVGYVRGFDYSLPNALAALGVESKELTVNDVRAGDLQKYSAIIVDNRVYESQTELIAANQRLLDYAKDGGTLIVFYHKSNEWNPDSRRGRPQLAPYKLILGDERITDENAPVTFLEPQHPLLNFPNKINHEDFAGWIQERGLYYPRDWDSQYHALFASNDPGEQPLRGGLLVADYGRGRYIYTSMVWYRQLRAGVPGAYRMLANMISYGHARK